MTNDWTDTLAGARMQVDQQFQERLEASEFTNQEWGLVMTAVEWEIVDPDDPEEATLVADTSKLPDIVPELETIQREMGGAQRPVESGPDGGGVFGRLRQYLDSLRSDTSDQADDERLAAAETLVEEYTLDLQEFLESRGRWEELCRAASGGGRSTPD